MSNKNIDPRDNSANQGNPNKGTTGVNKQYAQVHGNRGRQMNPNQGFNRKGGQGRGK